MIFFVFLNQTTEHSLRRPAGRKVFCKFRIKCLTVVYPCRTTGCKQWNIFILLKSFQQLSRFFHNRKVRGKVGVVNLIKAHSPEGCHKLALGICPFGHSEFSSYRHSDRGSYHTYYLGVRVVKSLPYRMYILFEGNGTCGTDRTTLTTFHAVCILQFSVKSSGNPHVISSVYKFKYPYALKFAAGSYAVSAEYALICIKYYCI